MRHPPNITPTPSHSTELSKFPNQINLLSFEAQARRMRKSVAYILGHLALPVILSLSLSPSSHFNLFVKLTFVVTFLFSFPLSNSTRRASIEGACIAQGKDNRGKTWLGKKMPAVDMGSYLISELVPFKCSLFSNLNHNLAKNHRTCPRCVCVIWL